MLSSHLVLGFSPPSAGQNHNLLGANKSFKSVEKLKYFGATVKKIKLQSRRESEQIQFGKCLLPFSSECFVFPFLSKNLTIKI
jgi:hypothetical protein